MSQTNIQYSLDLAVRPNMASRRVEKGMGNKRAIVAHSFDLQQ
ncbi:hypothetical protein [Edaphovirga cremea]|nr:hypothetical protein [Edaphovirga cremea]